MKIKRIVCLFISCFAIVPQAYADSQKHDKVQPSNKSKDIWVDIFIHGTVKPPLKIGDISKIKKDEVDNSFYGIAAGHIRKDPRFYQYQPIQGLGMYPIIINNKRGNASAAMAEIYDAQYKTYYPNEKNHYYTWGWSGLLSWSKREKESKGLLKDLIKLIQKYRSMGYSPNIRLIGYSHGGNVILNLATHKKAQHLCIAETLLIGMPVHKETDCLTNSPIFKKIYQIYSAADRAQSADVISTKYKFSHRKFKDRKDCTMPKDKIVHIRISTTFTMLDPVCKYVSRSYKVDPKHIELWSFGWKPKSYRKKFPLAPLSTASILPFIVYKTKDLGDDLWVEINPYQERMRVTSLKNNRSKDIWTLPFLSKEEFGHLAQIALKYEPHEHRLRNYECILRDALIYALDKQEEMFYNCMKARRLGKKYKGSSLDDEIVKPVTTFIEGTKAFLLM